MPVDVSGGRHFRMPRSTAAWACPACDQENIGPLDLGCVACGAGKPGPPTPQRQANAAPTPDVPESLRQAFDHWWRHECRSQISERSDLLLAFMAGYQFAQPAVRTPPEQTPLSVSGKEARTLAAALARFLEEVLASNPEEIASGEWLSVEDAQAVIARLLQEGQS